jgi:hypothetical protein
MIDASRTLRSLHRQMLLVVVSCACVQAVACAGRAPAVIAPAPPNARADAPWRSAPLSVAQVPRAYLSAWNVAENRTSCALIAFADGEIIRNALARQATFSGGWGVAYDRPQLRSAFGIAGAGVKAADPSYDEWPQRRSWSDGSTVGYGPEGGQGPNQLAYLRIAGQSCLYNVWSRLGQQHLEQLLQSIRFVETGAK